MRFQTKALLILSIFINSCSDYSKDTPPAPQIVTAPNNEGAAVLSRPIPTHLQNPNDGDFSTEKMLVNMGLNIISKNVDDFYHKSGLLQSSVENYCDALTYEDDFSKAESDVKNQWKQTMLSYHKLSMAPIGPLSENQSQLAKSIYSWPVISACGIDKEVIKNLPTTSELVADFPQNRKSLTAIEYLLFENTLISQCRPFEDANAASWSNKTILEKKKDRCHFALRLARDVQKSAAQLRRQWQPEQQNYTAALVDRSLYPNTNIAVNKMSDAFFSLENFRDTSLAIPLGLHQDCVDPSGRCIDKREHIWSGLTGEAALAKINGFQDAFFGSLHKNKYSLGFDDYLITQSHASLSEDIWISLEEAKSKLQLLITEDPTLAQIILNTPQEACNISGGTYESLAPICKMYKDIQNVTSKLKTDMLIILSLEAPATHAGDND